MQYNYSQGAIEWLDLPVDCASTDLIQCHNLYTVFYFTPDDCTVLQMSLKSAQTNNKELSETNMQLSKTSMELSKTSMELSRTSMELSKTGMELSRTSKELSTSDEHSI